MRALLATLALLAFAGTALAVERRGFGNDTLNGTDEPDRLYGDEGGDRLRGNGGDDTLDCGPGNDTAYVDRNDRTRGCERRIKRQ